MKNFFQATAILAAMSFSFSASAALDWYVGPVSRVALIGGGGFVVTVKTTALNDCAYSYAYFDASRLDANTLKNAYAIALTSASSGADMGIVIDKAVSGVGGNCYAQGMAADLRAK